MKLNTIAFSLCHSVYIRLYLALFVTGYDIGHDAFTCGDALTAHRQVDGVNGQKTLCSVETSQIHVPILFIKRVYIKRSICYV